MVDVTNILNQESTALRPNWGWLFALGILLIIMGFVGLGMVFGLTIVSILFFGVLLIGAGICNLFYVFKDRRWKGVLWHAVIAIFYVVAGGIIILMTRSLLELLSLPCLLACLSPLVSFV